MAERSCELVINSLTSVLHAALGNVRATLNEYIAYGIENILWIFAEKTANYFYLLP